jgi:hypothetical protein
MLKIDLAKAFDRLEWNFILLALARKGMHGHFINLIHACISTPTFSVIINGQAYANFTSTRGVRQGCPISPYLFVLAINELSIQLQQALSQTTLNGITLGPNCPLFTLFCLLMTFLFVEMQLSRRVKQSGIFFRIFALTLAKFQTGINQVLFSANL